jgi:IPT/TIG domain
MSPVMLPSSSLTISLVAHPENTTAVTSITSAQLPAGITTTAQFPLTVGSGGANLTLQTAPNIAAGNYPVTLNASAGSASATATIMVTAQTANLPAFYFANGSYTEVAMPSGGSGQIEVISGSNGSAQYNVVLSASGLPTGTTASFDPPVITPTQTSIVTLTAVSTAPLSQNVTVTVTGTPEAPISAASTSFLASVTAPQSSLPNNRSDYVSTEATPIAAVYDSVHGQIFSSNNAWNRVDVISETTHALIRSVPVRDPLGIDISQDGSTVWVATGSQIVYGINTSTFAVRRYQLPGLGTPTNSGTQAWQGYDIYALYDGTVMIYDGATLGSSFDYFALWDPSTNSLTGLKTPAEALPGSIIRSGDGKRLYSIAYDSGGECFYYDAVAKAFSGVVYVGGYGTLGAVNYDGSRVAALSDVGLNMYDGNLNLLGPIPGGGLVSGLVFSLTDGNLYETAAPVDLPFDMTVDSTSLQVLRVAPVTAIPEGDDEPPFLMPTTFAVDPTGVALGILPYGISFDDFTFAQAFSPSQPGFPNYLNHMAPYTGPLAGGTASGGFGDSFNITPGVWYGQNRGTASITSNNLTITSAPTAVPGPVNVKFLFPDGLEVFDPLFFSYGPLLQHSILSGASPDGQVSGQVSGYGLPNNSSGGSVTVGGASTTITNPPSVYAPTTGAPFPTSSVLTFTVPSGSPGPADVVVNTPNGQSTLSKGIFYAKSVTDYASPDTFTAVLLDPARKQLYLSAGDHVDVFSLSSNQFVAPIELSASGATKLFAGLALTPDGSLLLAADIPDGSVAVVNPDSPTSSYVIPIAAPTVGESGCTNGPMYVAPTTNNQAFVMLGGLPGINCGPGGSFFVANLSSHTASVINPGSTCSSGGSSVASTKNGSTVVLGGDTFCVYDAASQTYSSVTPGIVNGATISADGNIAASQWIFFDTTPHIVGTVARPDVYYISYSNDGLSNFYLLPQPKLNDSGSLYYLPYPTAFDIVDVQHGTLRMRFSLSETVSDTAVPMAIDSGGEFIYLLTNKGLTVVDLGNAPLSIGSLSQNPAAPGAKITVRGSGFNSSTAATVAGKTASVAYTDENTLTLTVPAAPSGPADIVLQNGDGTAYTLESGLTVN